MRNHTVVTEYILLGIPETEGLETVLFSLFSSLYLCTVLGNMLILSAIISSSRLHTPMYFFLANLSVFDLGFSSTTAPKMLSYLSVLSQGISFQGCATQLFFYHFLGCTECFLYTVMAYDRFVAICFPLRYVVIMNHRVCTILATGTWMGGCIHAIILTSLTFQLSYCGSNKVSYYFYLTCKNCVILMNDAVADLYKTERFCSCLVVGLCTYKALYESYFFHRLTLLNP